ncbi:hypothetical protein [Flavobacterium terrae]|uniref:Uncharacterized protein n=1 Tax=Flavobacterium terrae TaxID=415425 RepID=A0A1M6GKL1_9FLAO|nr:hypothetical protein [Flavobacterium terrae]SHJ10453.1 hypothetical protein SAMN05444363_2663 [Flavobacterium terrae]
MKNHFLFFLIVANFSVVAQNKCFEFVKNKIISNIEKYDSKKILPYYSEESKLWGYFDLTTGNKVVEPVLKKYKFFSPYIYLDFESDFESKNLNFENCRLRLYVIEEKFKIELPDTVLAEVAFNFSNNEIKKVKEIDGFEVDKQNNLISYNKKFYDNKKSDTRLSDFFKINNINYALATMDDHFTIVDQSGKIIKELKSKVSQPEFLYRDENEAFFVTEDKENNYKIQSIFGNTNSSKVSFNEILDLQLIKALGFSIVTIKGKMGVYDFVKFEWVIEPTNKFKIESLEYSSNIDVYDGDIVKTKEKILLNRKESDLYIVTEKNKIFDLKLNQIRPRNL